MIGLLVGMAILGLATGRGISWAANARRRGTKRPAPLGAGSPEAHETRLEGFPCKLGDVILLAQGEEAWLAGAVLLRERASHANDASDHERTVAALFIAPERGEGRAVYVRPRPDVSLDWMWPVPAVGVAVAGEPPSAIEHDGERFERVRRIPLALVVAGTGAPELGREAIVGEYEGGAGARLLVVVGSDVTAAWRGRRLEEGMYEVLPAR